MIQYKVIPISDPWAAIHDKQANHPGILNWESSAVKKKNMEVEISLVSSSSIDALEGLMSKLPGTDSRRLPVPDSPQRISQVTHGTNLQRSGNRENI